LEHFHVFSSHVVPVNQGWRLACHICQRL
jgi:hypothetical protein